MNVDFELPPDSVTSRPTEKATIKSEKLKRTFRKLGGAVVAVVASVVLLADSKVDLLGDATKDKTEEEFWGEAWRLKKNDFETRSPNIKFEQDLVTGTSYTVNERKPGSGLLNALDPSLRPKLVEFGDTCLADTSYDTRGGKDPTRAAEVSFSTDNPDIVVIWPVNPELEPLRLKGATGFGLQPANIEGLSILTRYGCNLEPFGSLS